MSIEVVVTGYSPISLDVTVPQGADGITFVPDKPTLAIASLSDGSSPVLTDAIINISVMRGINNDTASWVITATPTGCTGTLVDHTTYSTFTVEGMTSDTATVAFSAARTGFATLSSVATLIKAKQPDIATVVHAASAATLDDTDEIGFWDSVANALRKITVANLWAWVIGKIEGSTATTTPNDTDVLPGIKSDHTSLKYTWANLKAAIKTALGIAYTSGTLTIDGSASSSKIPTADEKTRLSDIQAATGATTALKLANLTSPASTTQQGVALLGASGGAAKLTKMPDGATAVYSQDAWATVDGWSVAGGSLAVAGGILTFTKSAASQYFQKSSGTALAGKVLLMRCRIASGTPDSTSLNIDNLGNMRSTINITGQWNTVMVQAFAVTAYPLIYVGSLGSANTYTLEIDWIWIGDYSYLTGSLSEEAARIADQLGDTPGVGVAASATITSNGTNVNTPASGTLTTTTSLPAADSTFKVGTKTYTWKSSLTPTEGEVLLEATVAACLTNARDAVNGTAGTLGTKHQCTANALFTAAASATILTVTAILRGTVGNGATYEIVAGAGSELTASGALATGGVDDTVTIGGKVYTFVGELANTEGQILVGATYAITLVNLRRAVNRTYPIAYNYGGTTPTYTAAAANPLVYMLAGTSQNLLYAGTQPSSSATEVFVPNPGILGNSITLAKSASATTLTLSGTTLTGGKDAVGDKIHTQLQTMPASTTKYGAALLAVDGGATAGTVVQANDSRLATQGTWTPTIIGSTVAGTQTYVKQVGNYTKKGREITCTAYVQISAKDVAMAGSVLIGGLPFPNKTQTANFISGHIGQYQGLTFSSGYTQIGLTLNSGDSVINILQSGSGKAASNIIASLLADSAYFVIGITYTI